jgi:hypothetical protein
LYWAIPIRPKVTAATPKIRSLMVALAALNHPEPGDMTLATIVKTMGDHDLNHMKQVEEIAG